ncbi:MULTISPECIES: DUF2586 family protein [Sphingobacterium]|uniref:DUF2586 family protein n=1 Tax=Sphingobacterium TaxID=28453 RepID=UPI00257EDECB|nr:MULTISPECIES: DUF2586 family protein [Sphingobacterium]
MNLPNIKFNIQNGGLLQQLVTSDKIIGIVLTGVSVADNVQINTAYQAFSLVEIENLGITAAGTNAFAYNFFSQFYNEAGQGAEIWFMLVSDATTYTNMLDITGQYAPKLLDAAGGAIRVLGALKKAAAEPVITDGLDGDVHTAVIKAQTLADTYTERFMPIRVIISGNNFSAVVADLKSYKTTENNRVVILIANNDGSKEASVGLALGRLARTPVQRNIGRVADGPIESLTAYFTNGAKVETLQTSWDAIHNKGYVFLRSFVGKSGYFFTDDVTLTKDTDDFNSLARGLVMDKAIIIAYATLVENLLDEINVTPLGKIHPAIIKSWQGQMENALSAMTAAGNISGQECFIDENQSILSTGVMQVTIRIQPVGYAKQVEVNIGFTTTLNNQ